MHLWSARATLPSMSTAPGWLDPRSAATTCVALLALAGCASAKPATESQLRARASFELFCHPSYVQTYELGEHMRGVVGCGNRAVYIEHCHPVGDGRRACFWEPGPTATAAPPPAPEAPRPAERRRSPPFPSRPALCRHRPRPIQLAPGQPARAIPAPSATSAAARQLSRAEAQSTTSTGKSLPPSPPPAVSTLSCRFSLATSTEQPARRTTASATEPSSRRRAPLRP